MDSENSNITIPSLSRRFNTFLHALAFVLGFSAIFIVGWGGAATVFGQVFVQYKTIIGQIGGAIVILFGLATIGILKIPWLNYDTRPEWNPQRKYGLASSSLMGVFFAAGWSPCIGTTLGAILTLGFYQKTSGQAMLLSSGYAFGLGIPFLIIGFGMDRALNLVRRMRRYQRAIQIASGLLMIAIGILLISGRMTIIAIWALQHGYYLDLPLGGTAVPSYTIAVLAGLLSFLSPCVLPLVPAYVGYLSGQAVNSAPKHREN
jgi:cytochrome c-type biogenesis protein